MEEKGLIPKKVTILYKMKEIFNRITGYKEGKRFIIDTEPKLRKYTEIELMRLASIEEKLKKALNQNQTEQSLVSGIEEKEAEMLLQWVVQNAREGLVSGNDVSVINDMSLSGYCGLGQGITGFTLINMGLLPNVSNAGDVFEGGGRHAFLSVGIPIKKANGEVQEKLYLVDTTYRQFFVRDEYTIMGKEFIKDKRFGNKVAPLEGYWVMQMPNGVEFAKKILADGYIELTEQNAKMYGDSFTLAGKDRQDYTKVPKKKELITGIDGKTYIERMVDPLFQEELDYEVEEFKQGQINIDTPLMKKEKIIEGLSDILTVSDRNEERLYADEEIVP